MSTASGIRRDARLGSGRQRFVPWLFALGLGLGALSVPGCVSSTESLYDEPAPPWVPARPDPGRVAACEACAGDACADERTACLQDEACLELLECRGRCDEPACLQTCTARFGHSPWYEDLWTCVTVDHCGSACGSGENFACVDHYEAARADDEASSFPVRFSYKNPRTGLAFAYTGDERDEQFVVGAHAESCLAPDLASSACQTIDEGTVGGDDSVELELVVHEGTHAFNGVVEVSLEHTSPASVTTTSSPLFQQLGWRDRYLTPPFAESTEFRMYVLWRGWFRAKAMSAMSKGSAPLDFATATPLASYLEDCMGAPASGVRFELPDMPELDILHQLSDGSVGDETDRGAAMVADLPESARRKALVVQAVQVGTGRVVARRNEVYVRPGWTTHVWLTPRPAR